MGCFGHKYSTEIIDDKSSFVYGNFYFKYGLSLDNWLSTGCLRHEIGIKLEAGND